MILNDLPASQKLSNKLKDYSEDLQALKSDSFLEWIRDSQDFFNKMLVSDLITYDLMWKLIVLKTFINFIEKNINLKH